MAVKIRLQRGGSKHTPKYRMVAADSRARRDGRFIEILGTYNPKARGQDEEYNIDMERVEHWLSVGAQPSETALSIIKLLRRTQPAEPAAVEATEAEASQEE